MKKLILLSLILFSITASAQNLTYAELKQALPNTPAVQCSSLTKKGVQCRGIALKNGKTCVFHSPFKTCGGITSKNANCKLRVSKTEMYCRYHQPKI